MTEWEWKEGNWKDFIKSGVLSNLGDVDLIKIGVPWSWNVHQHLNYNRLFWDVHKNGLKTPLLVRPWSFPFKARNKTRMGCRSDGSRLDNTPSPVYDQLPVYELVLGNMRYCAVYTQGQKSAPALILPNDEWEWDVEDLWAKYHPVFEGNYYSHPNYQMPSKYDQGFG